MVVAVAAGRGLRVMLGEEVGGQYGYGVVARRDGTLSCKDVRARLRPRYGRERGETREDTEPREITESLVISTILRPAEVKELAGSP
jgi:hypothetical protein